MTRASEVYAERGSSGIQIAFDCRDPEQEVLIQGFKKAFGVAFVRHEDLGVRECRCLTVLPGGAKAAER